MTGEAGGRADRVAAEELLMDTYDLDETCSKCEVDYELALVLGDGDCAIGVDICPNCGYKGRILSSDPEGVMMDHPYKQMFDVAMKWVPSWCPGWEDLSVDWRCSCGETWRSWEDAKLHIYKEHPDRTRLRSMHHDRYPWERGPELMEGRG